MRGLWIAELAVSSRTSEKLQVKQSLTIQEVEDALVCVRNLPYVWDEDEERGLRVIVQTEIRERRVLAVLYPAEDLGEDIWRLGSAYFV